MAVGNKSGVKKYNLSTPNRRHISKAAARGHKKGVVDQCFADVNVKSYIIQKVSQIIQSELKRMCSSEVSSVLQDRSNEAIKNFQWSTLIAEVEANAPVLHELLLACTKKRHPSANYNEHGVLGMCVAMLLKHRFHRMSLVHKIIGLILYTGHSGKQVKT